MTSSTIHLIRFRWHDIDGIKNMYDDFPWHKKQWQQLWQRHQTKRLPHALLLVGADGLGKKQFALRFAHALLCANPNHDGKACQQCHNCHLFQAQSHPDFMLVTPELEAKQIKINQVRDVVQFVNQSALQGGYRIIIIDPAASMNNNAANALLKSLEEPTEKTLFILINNQQLRLPVTIISRCQKIIFQTPLTADALTWLQKKNLSCASPELLLKLAEGAPLKALDLLAQDIFTLRENLYQGLYNLSRGIADPLQLAIEFQEKDLILVFHLLLSLLKELLLYSKTQLLDYIDYVQGAYANVLSSLNLNRQLLLEDLFIKWTQYVSC